MSQKSISRESVINQSIDCTCTAISYIVSHSSNEDFRKAVMTSLEVDRSFDSLMTIYKILMILYSIKFESFISVN